MAKAGTLPVSIASGPVDPCTRRAHEYPNDRHHRSDPVHHRHHPALPPRVMMNEQPALFAVPSPQPPDAEPPAPTGPRPWDQIDAADGELGWQYRWVTPARAREIRSVSRETLRS